MSAHVFTCSRAICTRGPLLAPTRWDTTSNARYATKIEAANVVKNGVQCIFSQKLGTPRRLHHLQAMTRFAVTAQTALTVARAQTGRCLRRTHLREQWRHQRHRHRWLERRRSRVHSKRHSQRHSNPSGRLVTAFGVGCCAGGPSRLTRPAARVLAVTRIGRRRGGCRCRRRCHRGGLCPVLHAEALWVDERTSHIVASFPMSPGTPGMLPGATAVTLLPPAALSPCAPLVCLPSSAPLLLPARGVLNAGGFPSAAVAEEPATAFGIGMLGGAGAPAVEVGGGHSWGLCLDHLLGFGDASRRREDI